MVEGKGVWILKEGILISEERFWMGKGYDAENERIWIQELGEEGEGYGSGMVGQMAQYIDLSDQKQNLMLI